MSGCVTNSEILLKSILENCQDIITVIDLDGRYIACNRAFLNITGVENEEEIIGKKVGDILDFEDKDLLYLYLKKVLETGNSQSYTFNINTASISKIIYQTSTPILVNGKISRILSVARDVTHEENLKKKLVNKITQLNTLFEYLPMLVYMKDENRKYITGSKHSKEFVETGVDRYSANVCIDKEFNDPIVAQEDKFVLETKQILIKEQKTRSINGDELWYKIYKAPIMQNTDEVSGIVTIAQNINNEKYLETQKELFLATLTHDLKNPVQAQLISLKMLNDGAFGQLNNTQKEMLEMIIESTTHMQDMLKTILTTYKFDNGIITLNKELFDAVELLNACINEVKAFGQNKNVNIIFDYNTKGQKLLADKQQLRRVISNILNNAMNYSYENTNLEIKIENNSEEMIFSFANKSPVIPENIKSQIFDKYVTGAKSFKNTGIGLGLYFAKKVIDAHCGHIYLEANGEDNKFVFRIPLINENLQSSIAW